MLLVVATAALLALPAGAVAKPGYFTIGPGIQAEFRVAGSNGYTIDVRAGAEAGQRPSVSASARKGGASVSYGVSTPIGEGGSFNVHLPGVGRVAVRFEARSEDTRKAPDNCKGRSTGVQHGYFRGTIRLRGERGYTEVDRTSAPGTLTRSYRQVCANGPPVNGGHTRHHQAKTPPARSSRLVAGTLPLGRSVDFSAGETQLGKTLLGPSFLATALDRRGRMLVLTVINSFGRGKLISSAPGSPQTVEVKPPAPFVGSAVFALTSPKTSTFEGDLSVEMPGLGTVSLAGPDHWSVLCEERKCTDTGPPGLQILESDFTVGD